MMKPRYQVPSIALVVVCVSVAVGLAGPGLIPLPTTTDNFYLRGTQPGALAAGNELFTANNDCRGCHQHFGEPAPHAVIPEEWSGSLMAQAARDPVFYAALDIAEADAPGSGNMCIRCHAPRAWLNGRATPTDGSAISRGDRDGVMCHFCHRLVDPFDVGFNAPQIDETILYELGDDAPLQSYDHGNPPSAGNNGSGGYVIDPFDRRRGPFPLTQDGFPSPPAVICYEFHASATYGKCEDDFGDPAGCPTFRSPFHRRSDICGTCHDVSNPSFHLNPVSGDFEFNGPGVAHPTGDKFDMAPSERTYSEWLKSDFAVGQGVDMGGRFGGPGQIFVSQCQHCHMPAHTSMGCAFNSQPRDDIPSHTFSGASHWVLDAIALHYGPDGPLPGFPPPDPINGPDLEQHTVDALAANKLRNIGHLGLAADLEASLDDSQSPGTYQLLVRVVNQAGHKLPTGYPEGRRVFLTVEFFNCDDLVVPFDVRGDYDPLTANLDAATTKVYEMVGGMDEALAAMTGHAAGATHDFALTNTVIKDNRIPPRGFTNEKFAAIVASPVGYSYADGQYWDDTYFDIPATAVGARILLSYQATSRAYIEFLRDNNPNAGIDPTNRGELAYALWETFGKSLPVVMSEIGTDALFPLDPSGIINCPGRIGSLSIAEFIEVLLDVTADPGLRIAADMDGSGEVNGDDIQLFVDHLLGY